MKKNNVYNVEPVAVATPVIDTKEEITIKATPVEVNDILDYEVRIAECYARDDIHDIRIRNNYLSIFKIIELAKEGYYITPCNLLEELEPFFQHALFIEYWYDDDPDFEQKLSELGILPTFIIKHKGTKYCWYGTDNYATLVYVLEEPITNAILMDDIYRYLCKLLFSSEYTDAEIDSYNAYDYGYITGVTVNNILYTPVEGGTAHV